MSPQRLPGKAWQYEARPVYILIIVTTKLFLLFFAPATHGLLDVPLPVLAADHEPYLSGWVSRDGRVRVLHRWENLFALLFEASDE